MAQIVKGVAQEGLGLCVRAKGLPLGGAVAAATRLCLIGSAHNDVIVVLIVAEAYASKLNCLAKAIRARERAETAAEAEGGSSADSEINKQAGYSAARCVCAWVQVLVATVVPTKCQHSHTHTRTPHLANKVRQKAKQKQNKKNEKILLTTTSAKEGN